MQTEEITIKRMRCSERVKQNLKTNIIKVIKQIHNSYECLNRVWGIRQMKLQSQYKFHFYKRYKLNNFLPLIWRFSWLKAYRTMVHRHKTADNPIHSKNCSMKTQNAWVHYWSLRKSIISANIIGDLSGPDGSGRCNKAVKWKNTVA